MRADEFSRLHALGFDHGGGGGRGQKFRQGFAGFGVIGIGRDAGREDGDALQLAGHRADDVDAGHRHQLGHLLQSDLDLAAQEIKSDQSGRSAGAENRFGLERVGDAEPLEHAPQMNAARAAADRIAHADRFRREQRLLERGDRRDVGLGRAGAHRDADGGARDIDAGAGDDAALLDQFIDAFAG